MSNNIFFLFFHKTSLFHSQFTQEIGKAFGRGVALFIRLNMFEREFGSSLEDLAKETESPGFSQTPRWAVWEPWLLCGLEKRL